MSNPTAKQADRPWGNSSGLPERASCPILNAKAAALRGEREPLRHIKMLMLLLAARHDWRGRDEEILAAGYENPGDFWRASLSEPRSVDNFAHHMAGLLIDPVEKQSMLDARTGRTHSAAFFHVRKAIELADVNSSIFVTTGRGRLVLPLEACRQFAASPLYRGLLTPSLLAFLDADRTGEDIAEVLAPPGTNEMPAGPKAPRVSPADVDDCVKAYLECETKPSQKGCVKFVKKKHPGASRDKQIRPVYERLGPPPKIGRPPINR